MDMRLNGSKLEIDITDLVNHMDEEARKVFYQELAFEEKLLECCMDLLTKNSAFDDYYTSTTYGGVIDRLSDRLKDKCLPLMDTASQELISNLKSDLKYTAEDRDKYQKHCWNLESRWEYDVRWFDGTPLSEEDIEYLKLRRPNRPPKMEN